MSQIRVWVKVNDMVRAVVKLVVCSGGFRSRCHRSEGDGDILLRSDKEFWEAL